MSGVLVFNGIEETRKHGLVIIIVRYILQSSLKSRTVLFNYIPKA